MRYGPWAYGRLTAHKVEIACGIGSHIYLPVISLGFFFRKGDRAPVSASIDAYDPLLNYLSAEFTKDFVKIGIALNNVSYFKLSFLRAKLIINHIFRIFKLYKSYLFILKIPPACL